MKRLAKVYVLLWSLGLACGMPANAPAASTTEYSAGHADIGLTYNNGELSLDYYFGEDAAVLDGMVTPVEVIANPSTAHVRVPDEAIFTFTLPAPFLDSGIGDSIWRLPFGQEIGVPFLGIDSRRLDIGVTNAVLSMTDFSGPGEFALYQVGSFGPITFLQTNNGIDPVGDDMFSYPFHDHFNFGFTEPGIYNVELTATANAAGVGQVSDVETFTFFVGTATAIPEPSSFMVIGFGIVGLLTRRRTRSRK
ncbi:MAG: choice-of-anchor M domain-containing protein [Planctomycetota bacterium]